jgi:hypothetical protein
MVEILVENLKQIKVGKLAAKLRRANEELAEEKQKAEKIKANEKTAKKAKAARRKAKTTEETARIAAEKGEVERRRRIREERASDQAATQRADERAAAERAVVTAHAATQQRIREGQKAAAAAAKQAVAEQEVAAHSLCRRLLNGVKTGHPLNKIKNKPPHVSYHYARVLLELTKKSKLKSTEHPAPSTRREKPENKHILSDKSTEQINNIIDCKARGQKIMENQDDATKQRVPDQEEAMVEESIEEMVRRLERTLDEEFKNFEQTKDPCPKATAAAIETAAAAEVPEQKVPGTVGLEELEIQNKEFNNSFFAMTPASADMRTPEQVPSLQPPATNSKWNMEEATKQQNPGGSGQQKPPEMEHDRRPLRA